MTEREALAIYKSILRNAEPFQPYGYAHSRAWDLNTLHASGFPQTAAMLRSLLPVLSDAGLVR